MTERTLFCYIVSILWIIISILGSMGPDKIEERNRLEEENKKKENL